MVRLSGLEKNLLTTMLDIMQQGRKKLISDFTSEDPSIFIPMFKYENNSRLMEISLENYFMGWINFHFIYFEKFSESELTDYTSFFREMEAFINKHIATKELSCKESRDFIMAMLREKGMLLQRLLHTSDKSDSAYNRLVHSYEKDKALFERKIKALMEEP